MAEKFLIKLLAITEKCHEFVFYHLDVVFKKIDARVLFYVNMISMKMKEKNSASSVDYGSLYNMLYIGQKRGDGCGRKVYASDGMDGITHNLFIPIAESSFQAARQSV